MTNFAISQISTLVNISTPTKTFSVLIHTSLKIIVINAKGQIVKKPKKPKKPKGDMKVVSEDVRFRR